MNKIRMFLIVMTVCAIATPLVAQEEEKPPPMVAKNHFVTVNSGQALEFEAAYKGHLEWHANKNDTWYWHTWQITNGQNLGQYIIRTGNHTWADFDEHAEFSKEDSAHYLENVSGYVKKLSSNMVVAVPDISKWPDDYGIPTMVDCQRLPDRYSQYSQAFYHTIEKIHKAIVEKEIALHLLLVASSPVAVKDLARPGSWYSHSRAGPSTVRAGATGILEDGRGGLRRLRNRPDPQNDGVQGHTSTRRTSWPPIGWTSATTHQNNRIPND